MCNIAWCSFTWEAFSGIFAGVFAVVGAVVVGLKQQKILEKQTTIERLNLRIETFDKRWEVYEDVVAWFREHWQTGDRPASDTESKYIRAIEKSKFLFRPEVSEQLDLWFKDMIRLRFFNQEIQRAGISEERHQEVNDEIERISAELLGAANKISKLFGEEMRLSDHHLTLPPIDIEPTKIDA